MEKENISEIQITKRFKSWYLVPNKHKGIIKDSIRVYRIDKYRRLSHISYNILEDDHNNIVIIPSSIYDNYMITYRVHGDFKKYIIGHNEYLRCKDYMDRVETVIDNNTTHMTMNQKQELREELSALSKERLIEKYIALYAKCGGM